MLKIIKNKEGFILSLDVFDENKKVVQSLKTDGQIICQYLYEYDDEGRMISSAKKNGFIITYEYSGNITIVRNNINDEEIKYIEVFDDNGNCIHLDYLDEEHPEYNIDFINEYNDKGLLTHIIRDNGSEWFLEYDDNGNCVHLKNIRESEVYEKWVEYDELGREIHSKDSDGEELFFTYLED